MLCGHPFEMNIFPRYALGLEGSAALDKSIAILGHRGPSLSVVILKFRALMI